MINEFKCEWCGSDLLNIREIEAKICEPCLMDYDDGLVDEYGDYVDAEEMYDD